MRRPLSTRKVCAHVTAVNSGQDEDQRLFSLGRRIRGKLVSRCLQSSQNSLRAADTREELMIIQKMTHISGFYGTESFCLRGARPGRAHCPRAGSSRRPS